MTQHPALVHQHKVDAPTGVMLTFHGLNLAPHCMDPICEAAHTWGIESFRVSLSGHGDHHEAPTNTQSKTQARIKAARRVTTQAWRTQAAQAYDIAQERAKECDVPLYLSGFSLGGLIANDLLLDPENPRHVDKMLLFAPALTIKPFANLLRPLRPFTKLVLPSGSPAPYRSNWGTSIAMYNGLLDLNDSYKAAPKQSTNIPTLVLLHKRDEFIPWRHMNALIEREGLSTWRLAEVKKKAEYRRSPSHLIIDKPSLGEESWTEMCLLIQNFLLDQ